MLRRKLRRFLGDQPLPAGLEPLLLAIDEDYAQADRDRGLLERSLELTSQELLGANHRLREELAAREAFAVAIKSQWDEFRALIEEIPVGVAVLRGSHVALANAALSRSLGRAPGELLGATLFDLVHEDDHPTIREHLEAHGRTGEPVRGGEVRWRRHDGRTAWLDVELARTLAFEGAAAVLLVARDVTELRALNRKLLVSSRLASVGTMAAGVAHEINNPLAYLISNLEYVLLKIETRAAPSTPEDVGLAQAIRESLQGAERVRRIVRDLRAFSRVEEESLCPCDVIEVLESSVRLVNNDLRHRARLERHLEPVPLVNANAGRLGQVFLNLLLNAAQAIPEGAAERNVIEVSVRSPAPGQLVVIEVRDSGKGIPPATMARLFEPFFTTKAPGLGTGLGLSICHSIVSAMGGSIDVESQLGKGSVFRVSIPAATADERPLTAHPASEPVKRLKVLLIDDDELAARGIARLVGLRHEVFVESSSLRALERLCHGEEFDAILCDVMMPELPGDALYRRLRDAAPEAARRMVFMTGGAFTTSTRAFLESTSNAWVEKPIDLARLQQALLGAAEHPPPLEPVESCAAGR